MALRIRRALEDVQGDGLFLVTWTEYGRTTVIHLEDYREMRIITNITDVIPVTPPTPIKNCAQGRPTCSNAAATGASTFI